VRRLNDWFANICQNRTNPVNYRSTLNTRNEEHYEDSTSTSLSSNTEEEKSSPNQEKLSTSCPFQSVQDNKSENETEEEQKSAELR
jgi:hypothetical protein